MNNAEHGANQWLVSDAWPYVYPSWDVVAAPGAPGTLVGGLWNPDAAAELKASKLPGMTLDDVAVGTPPVTGGLNVGGLGRAPGGMLGRGIVGGAP